MSGRGADDAAAAAAAAALRRKRRKKKKSVEQKHDMAVDSSGDDEDEDGERRSGGRKRGTGEEHFTNVMRQRDLEVKELEKRKRTKIDKDRTRRTTDPNQREGDGEYAGYKPEILRWYADDTDEYDGAAGRRGDGRHETPLLRKRIRQLPPTQEQINAEYQRVRDSLQDKVSPNNETLWSFYREMKANPLVRAAFRKLMPYVIGSGITVEIKGIGEEDVDIASVSPDFVNTEVRTFSKEWYFLQWVWGFAVCSGEDSKHLKGIDKPVVVRKGLWTVEFGYKRHERVWFVFKVNGKGVNESREIMEDAFVSCMHPPEDDGELSSPLWVLRHMIREYTKMWNNIASTIDNNAHPEILVEVASVGSSGTNPSIGGRGTIGAFNPSTSTLFTDGDLLGMDAQKESDMNDSQRHELMVAKGITYGLNKGIIQMVSQGNNTDEAESEAKRLDRRERTWNNPIVLPRGQRVTSTPESKLPSDMQKYVNMIVHLVATHLGIPYHAMVNDSQMHAANADIEMRDMNESIKYEQREVAPVVKDALHTIWKSEIDELRKVRNEVYRQEREESEGYKELVKAAGGREIKMLDALIDSFDSMKISIEVRFNHTPLTSQDRLTHLWEKRIIDHETFARHSLTVTGLSTRDMAPKEGRDLFEQQENELRKALVDQAKMAATQQPQQQQMNRSAMASTATTKSGEGASGTAGQKSKKNDASSSSEYGSMDGASSGLSGAEKKRKAVSNRLEK